MRSFLTRAVLVAFAVGLLTAQVQSGPAYADPDCKQLDAATGACVIWVNAPPSAAAAPVKQEPTDTGSGAACYWDGTDQGISDPPPGPVACTSPDGYWSNSYNCYIQMLEPQPLAGDPAWQGHEPGDGAVYSCYQPQTDILLSVWSQDAPAGSGAGPTPREVAQLAIERMELRAIEIGIAPRPGPDSVGLVGMPVWMWVQSPDDNTFGPKTASATAGGMTITATARVREITWDMGDGTEVVCTAAGTPYEPSFGRRESPDCGHIYEKSSAPMADEAYDVTATSTWVVTWSGAGQTGTILLNGLTRSTQIRIGEAQVLVS